MIKPLSLSEEKQKKIVSWLDEEIGSALSSRDELEGKWSTWLNMFEAKPAQRVKNFPFENCSNIVIPSMSITVNAFIARQYNTLFQYRPFWTVTPLSKQWTDHANPTQRLLEYSQRFEMKLLQRLIPWLYDTSMYGTGISKLVWVIENIKDKVYDDTGKIIEKDVMVSDGPRFIPIPLEDFIIPPNATDIQVCPWVDHRFRLNYPQMMLRQKLGYYQNVDKLESFVKSEANNLKGETERLQYLERSLETKEYELHEVWCDYDYDNDGWAEKCVFTISRDARIIVRATLNPWKHRQRPFFATQCFPRPHSVYGIGFGQKLELLQEAITTQANQAIDNATLANARCIKYKKGTGIKAPLKIYAGKAIGVTDMTDIDTFQLGEIYPSQNLIINLLRDIVERETGLSDYNLGKESPIVGTGATATSTLALIQEGNKLFDFLLKPMRCDLSDMAFHTYSLYSQFKPSGLTFSLLGDDGQFVEQTWQASEEDVKRGLQFEITASSAYVNQALERESWMALMNLIMGYYQKIFEAAGLMTNPMAPPELRQLVSKMVQSGSLMMNRIVERWGILDKDRLILQPEDLVSLSAQAEQAAPQRMMQAMMAQAQAQQPRGGANVRGQQPGPGGNQPGRPGGAPRPTNSPGVPALPNPASRPPA